MRERERAQFETLYIPSAVFLLTDNSRAGYIVGDSDCARKARVDFCAILPKLRCKI